MLKNKIIFCFSANAAFLALQAAQHIGTEAELNQTQETVAQLMATLVGLRGQGYVVGVGERSPEQPYHRGRYILFKTCSFLALFWERRKFFCNLNFSWPCTYHINTPL